MKKNLKSRIKMIKHGFAPNAIAPALCNLYNIG